MQSARAKPDFVSWFNFSVFKPVLVANFIKSLISCRIVSCLSWSSQGQGFSPAIGVAPEGKNRQGSACSSVTRAPMRIRLPTLGAWNK